MCFFAWLYTTKPDRSHFKMVVAGLPCLFLAQALRIEVVFGRNSIRASHWRPEPALQRPRRFAKTGSVK